MLISCHECKKKVSDQATACTNCSLPIGEAVKTLVQLDSAPHKRRKYKKMLLVFVPVFFVGIIAAANAAFSGDDTKSNFWFIVGIFGFIGTIYSFIGHWLNKP